MDERTEVFFDESLRLHLYGRCKCGGVLDVRGLLNPDGAQLFCPYCSRDAGMAPREPDGT